MEADFFRKRREVRMALTKGQPLYLPPYSPDLNPIEMLWSKMKAILRKLGCNIAALLSRMVAHALALVSPEDCFGWFTADGY